MISQRLLWGLVLCAGIPICAQGGVMSFKITSTAFSNGASIAKNYTCDGPDVSPSLNWTGAPAGTQSFALIADDPHAPAGTRVQWVLYNLPANAREMPGGCRN